MYRFYSYTDYCVWNHLQNTTLIGQSLYKILVWSMPLSIFSVCPDQFLGHTGIIYRDTLKIPVGIYGYLSGTRQKILYM